MLRTDNLQLNLIVNGDESRKKLNELTTQAFELRKEMKKIKDQELLGKKQQELNKIESEMEDIRHEIGITGMSMKELAERSKSLNAILGNMDPNTAEFKAYKQELDEVNHRHAELRRGAQETGKIISKETSGFNLAGIVAGGMAAYAAISTVFSGIKNGIMSSLEAYRENEKAIQKVEQAIKQTGGVAGLSLKQLTDSANALQKTTLFGDEEILNSATAQLLTFTNIAGSNFLKAQQAAMDLSTVLDSDLQSASIQVGKALNDPITGLTALRKVGVSFTDEQKRMIKELAETNRLEEAQALILQELNRQYGGQAEAVAKGTGAMKQAGNQLGELAETFGGFIGKIITPVLSMFGKFAASTNELLQPVQSAIDIFREHGRTVAVLVRDIDPLLDRYDQLKSKTSLNTSEQNELKQIISQVAAVMPGAATAFDQYGNAIDISTQRVREYIRGQVMLLRYENRKAIDETISDLAEVNIAIEQSKTTMNQISKTGTFPVFEPQSNMGAKTGGSGSDVRSANQNEIAEAQRRNQELVNTQLALNTKLSQLRGDALQQSINAYEAEKRAAEDAALTITEYKQMTMEELRNLAEDGNDTQQKEAKAEIKKREDLQKSAEENARYMKKIAEDLENARIQIIKDSKERELKMEELAYKKKLSGIKGSSELERQLRYALEEEYQTKIKAIRMKYDSEEQAKNLELEKRKWETKLKGLSEGSLGWFNVSQEILALQREAELRNTELTEEQKIAIEEKYRQLRENLNQAPDNSGIQAKLDSRMATEWEANKMMLERTGQMTIKKKKEILEQERDMALAAAGDNVEEQMLIWEKYYQKLKDLGMEWLYHTTNALSIIVNSFSQFDQALAQYEQAQLQRNEDNNNKKKESLKRQLDAGLIDKKQYDDQVSMMDKELAAKKRKIAHDEAVRQKAISIVQAIINTAQAITAALTVPYVGIALAVVAGIMGAAQIALIAATPIPEAAKGRYGALKGSKQAAAGRYDVIGKEDNKLYRDVPLIKQPESGVYDRPTLFAETGREIILNPKHTENLMRFRPDLVHAIMQVPQRAFGFYPDVSSRGSAVAAPVMVQFTPETLRAMEAFQEQIKRPLTSTIVYDNIIDSMAQVSRIEQNATR